MFDVLICERCGLLHPLSYDGLTCRQPDCKGKLIPTRMLFPTEGDEIEKNEQQKPI